MRNPVYCLIHPGTLLIAGGCHKCLKKEAKRLKKELKREKKRKKKKRKKVRDELNLPVVP